ncbi:hypothetical protein FQZ97_722820 [compost metagenome]
MLESFRHLSAGPLPFLRSICGATSQYRSPSSVGSAMPLSDRMLISMSGERGMAVTPSLTSISTISCAPAFQAMKTPFWATQTLPPSLFASHVPVSLSRSMLSVTSRVTGTPVSLPLGPLRLSRSTEALSALETSSVRRDLEGRPCTALSMSV